MTTSDSPTPPLDLDPIRARADAATPGPWVAYDDGLVWSEPPRMGDPMCGASDPAHAEFIAHARTDVPALLAEIERLRDPATESTLLKVYTARIAELEAKAAEDLASIERWSRATVDARAERDSARLKLGELRAACNELTAERDEFAARNSMSIAKADERRRELEYARSTLDAIYALTVHLEREHHPATDVGLVAQRLRKLLSATETPAATTGTTEPREAGSVDAGGLSGPVPAEVYLAASEARLHAAYPVEAERATMATENTASIVASKPSFRAAVEVAYRAGSARTPGGHRAVTRTLRLTDVFVDHPRDQLGTGLTAYPDEATARAAAGTAAKVYRLVEVQRTDGGPWCCDTCRRIAEAANPLNADNAEAPDVQP